MRASAKCKCFPDSQRAQYWDSLAALLLVEATQNALCIFNKINSWGNAFKKRATNAFPLLLRCEYRKKFYYPSLGKLYGLMTSLSCHFYLLFGNVCQPVLQPFPAAENSLYKMPKQSSTADPKCFIALRLLFCLLLRQNRKSLHSASLVLKAILAQGHKAPTVTWDLFLVGVDVKGLFSVVC